MSENQIITPDKEKEAEALNNVYSKQIDYLISVFSKEEVDSFLRNIYNDPDYGEKGYYSHFCKKCGGSWSFKSKIEVKIFREFHAVSGCVMKYNPTLRDGKRLMVTQTRSSELVPYKFMDFIKSYLNILIELPV